MSVKVKFYSLFKLNLKTSGIEYEINSSITVSDLLKKLDEDFDGYFSEKLLEGGTITPGSIILINGQNIFHIDKLNSKINDGDIVTLFPPAAGG
ncbi:MULTISPECIES: MoaD family protein [unclassified Halanaerobium]|uniref:MoaD family protein n=1 Tax=unclassified Halanaerobium TaxID=2641197 RepID=UPI000DF4374B|nr:MULTISPECIES: MoaD family protein [unclassified Halanaerobium]RCW48687.1 molybdopterin synthase subunit MoaD [Halanaerobium sp. MA284_MarDTE_T2]RCW86569.1 molybdopterin synthase subunit MoaD [Halanaerobium sp. DL-01]